MAFENELPPVAASVTGPAQDGVFRVPDAGSPLHYTADGAHVLETARLTIRAQARQVAELADHNRELLDVLAAVRAACEAGQTAARNRIAQASPDALRWEGKRAAYAEIAALVKPVE